MISLVSQALPHMDIGDLWPSPVMAAWNEYSANTTSVRDVVGNLMGNYSKKGFCCALLTVERYPKRIAQICQNG